MPSGRTILKTGGGIAAGIAAILIIWLATGEKVELEIPEGISFEEVNWEVLIPEEIVSGEIVADILEFEDAGFVLQTSDIKPALLGMAKMESIALGTADIESAPLRVVETLKLSDKNFYESAKRSKEIRAVISIDRPSAAIPVFYKALGQFDADAKLRKLRMYMRKGYKSLLVFKDLEGDWKKKYGKIFPFAKDSICVLDWEIGEFNGEIIKEFVEFVRPKEIVLSWGSANNMDQASNLEELALDLRGAVEYAKKGNPKIFVWVTVCGGTHVNRIEWANLIRDIPFDGVALWNVHSLPTNWKTAGFLNFPLFWCKNYLGDRPVALAGLYGAKIWMVTTEEEKKAARKYVWSNVPDAIKEAKRLGYASVWVQIGSIPDNIYLK